MFVVSAMMVVRAVGAERGIVLEATPEDSGMFLSDLHLHTPLLVPWSLSILVVSAFSVQVSRLGHAGLDHDIGVVIYHYWLCIRR